MAGVFGRGGVSAEESRDDIERRSIQLAGHAQQLHLGSLVEAVAGFRFERSGASESHDADPAAGFALKPQSGPASHGVHASQDAAAAGGDLGVVVTFKAHLVVGDARRTEDDVRMRIDKPGHDDLAGDVNLAGFARHGEVFNTARGADLGDVAVLDQQGSVADDAEVAQRETAARAAGAAQGKQLAGAAYEKHFTHEPFSDRGTRTSWVRAKRRASS